MDKINTNGLVRYLYYTNYWHPTGESEPKGQRPSPAKNEQKLEFSNKWKILFVVSAIACGISLILTIYNAVRSKNPYVTTIDLCIDNFLRYGDSAGDKTATGSVEVTFGEGRVAGIAVTEGKIIVNIKEGSLMLAEQNELISVMVSYSDGYNDPDPDKGQYFYYREVDTAEEKEAIACLVKDDKVRTAYVFTWVGFTYHMNEVGTFQCIIVFSDTPATFSIRIYSADFKHTVPNQFRIYDAITPYSFDYGITASEVVGKKLIKIHTESIPVIDNYPTIATDESCMC